MNTLTVNPTQQVIEVTTSKHPTSGQLLIHFPGLPRPVPLFWSARQQKVCFRLLRASCNLKEVLTFLGFPEEHVRREVQNGNPQVVVALSHPTRQEWQEWQDMPI